MKKLKSIAVFLIASIVTVCSSGVNVPLEVRAYEAPTDIHIIVETKEIDIEDIPEDRWVTLNIYTENCPPYDALELVFERDSRLGFAQYTPFSPVVDLPNMGGLTATYGSKIAPNFMSCLIPSTDTFIDYNGALIQVHLILPENINDGDFYKFEPLRKCDAEYTVSSSIYFGDDFDSVFRETPFSQLTGGGIRITRKAPPETDPPQTEPPVVIPENTPAPEVNNNVPSQEAPPENNNAQPEGNNQNVSHETQTEAVTEGVTEAKETTVTQTEISTTTVTVTEKTTTTTEETKVSASDTTASETVTTAEIIEETKEKSSNILHIIIPVSIAAVLSAVFILIKKVKGKAQ